MILLHNTESTVDAHPHKSERSDSDRFLDLHWIVPSEGPSLPLVRNCPSAFRQYRTLKCFFVDGQPIFIFSSCTLSILTPILAQGSSIRALTYTTQVRSGGSQVFVGNRNHRAEPVSVLRRAPTLTDEQRQQRVGSRALSPSELWPQSSKERPQESQGIDLLRSIQLSPGKPDTVFQTDKPYENQQTLYLAPRSANQDVPLDDDPLTKIDNAAALSTMKPQRTPEPVGVDLEQDQRTNRFDLLNSLPCAHEGCHSI